MTMTFVDIDALVADKNELRLLVTGSRYYKDYARLSSELNALSDCLPEDVSLRVIHGGAHGADSLSQRWADEHHVPADVYMAEWDEHGKAAGPIRNQRMLDEGKPDIVIGFPLPGSRGTKHMMTIASQANVPVIAVPHDD